MTLRELTIEFSINESKTLLLEAEKYLNNKYDPKFSLEHPKLVVDLATLFATCFQINALMQKKEHDDE